MLVVVVLVLLLAAGLAGVLAAGFMVFLAVVVLGFEAVLAFVAGAAAGFAAGSVTVLVLEFSAANTNPGTAKLMHKLIKKRLMEHLRGLTCRVRNQEPASA